MGLNPMELHEYFRHNKSICFPRWLTEIRISEASKLLIRKPYVSAAAIGEEVGFSDRSNFSKHFKDKMGCTPAQWRRYSPLKRFAKTTFSSLYRHRKYLIGRVRNRDF